MLSRKEAEYMTEHPFNIVCENCGNPHITCYGMVRDDEIQFHCSECEHIWIEEVEEESEEYVIQEEKQVA